MDTFIGIGLVPLPWLHMTSVTPVFRSDPIGGSEPVSGCSFNSFYLLFIYLFLFSKVSRPESLARLDPGLLRPFSFVLSKTFLFMSFHFSVFNYVEAVSNGRLINIYFYTIRLENGVSCLYKMIYKTIV